jgi:hypothetical protein
MRLKIMLVLMRSRVSTANGMKMIGIIVFLLKMEAVSVCEAPVSFV